ncbi:MAG TPA: hypothetical protein V6D08_00105 [Candidatus Obscuribacterales bacterium]
MAQRKPERPSLDQVLRLVEQLTPAEQEELGRKLISKSWGRSWQELCEKVDEYTKDLPPLSEEEIVEEMKSIRAELRSMRDQGGN